MRFARFAAPLCAAALLALTVTAAPAAARVPHPRRHLPAQIEPLAPYVGQTSCDPHIKRGTQKLARRLVHTYRGTSYNSTYACGTDGTQSEHYEGRAIDWMVSVRNHHQHAVARAFLHWLLRTSHVGNRFAMARRLGVMYVIYNNRMWGAWDVRWEDYNHCSRHRAHAYDNACHRTHMHISLSWNGARGRTTFWDGRVSRTDWGPCRTRGHKYAPDWRRPNRTGCPLPHHR